MSRRNFIFAVSLCFATAAWENPARAQSSVELNTQTGELIIVNDFLLTDEQVEIFIDSPPLGQKGPRELVVDHSHLGESRFPFFGGLQRIIFYGDEDRDTVLNNTGIYRIEMLAFGGGGDDYLRGGNGPDLLFGGHGNDILIGKKGDDRLEGEEGYDHLYGNQGNDLLRPGDDAAEGELVGGWGNDTAEIYSYTQFDVISLGGQAGDETVLLDP